MSNYYWKAAQVSTRALLPDRLVKGRAYFVADEQIIIVDHGRGPVEYGGVPGPQGTPGEPQPQLQAQIDSLTEASTSTSSTIWELWQRVREKDKRQGERLESEAARIRSEIAAEHAETVARLEAQASTDARQQAEIDSLTEASLTTSKTLWDNWTATLEKTDTLTETDKQQQEAIDALSDSLSTTTARLESNTSTDARQQAEIDSLTEASLTTSKTLWDNWTATLRQIASLRETDTEHLALIESLDSALTADRWVFAHNHEETLSRLDEQSLTLNHTTGYITDTDAKLQEQIDILSHAVIKLSTAMWDLAKRREQEREHLATVLEDFSDRLQSQVNSLTSAALSLSDAVHTTLTSYHTKIARLFEALTTLHPTYSWPEEHTPSSGDSNITGDPLDGEVITTDYGSWGIEQVMNEDGTVTFILDQQDKMDNQILTTRYGSWVIEETPNDDGTVSYELTLRELYIDALKAGYKVQAGEDKYTITSYEKSDGMITLTMSKD